MRTLGLLVAYASLIAMALSWIAALFFYMRTFGAVTPEQSYLRGQLVFNWLFANGKLTGEAREHAHKVNIAMAVFFVCLIISGAAFIVAVAPR